ncbi:MAG: Smr/MutS family protein [Alphaproteobacteria bacterium]
MNDLSLWEELKKTIVPLKEGITECVRTPLSPRLRVRRAAPEQISYVLNLHGMTLEQAYEAVKKFVARHQRIGSCGITIITGKGLNKIGAIKKEIPLWFETPFFNDKIADFSWKNDGGALDIRLKRIKK